MNNAANGNSLAPLGHARLFQRIFVSVASLSCLAGLSTAPTPAEAAQLPALPQSFIDTTYAPPSGKTTIVNAGGNLQAAINNAAPGDTIVLQAGATFTGPFTLPNKSGAGWIYIQSSAYSSLPAPGTRVAPADAANMPKIVLTDPNRSAIETSIGAHGYRFVGIEITTAANVHAYQLISIGQGNETSISQLPTDITFDRCYVHGDATVGTRRGVELDAVRGAVVDSWFSDFKEQGADTQAIWALNTPGPLKVVNNELQAAGENLMFGGADPTIQNVVPSDVEIRGNHFFKPLSWIGSIWTVKNLLELKLGVRVLIEGNIFENNWLAGQDGEGIVITPRNQNGSAPWSVTKDITIRLNQVLNVGKGFNISGTDDTYSSQFTQRVLVENNLVNVTGLQNATARTFQFTHGASNVTVRHNTGFTISRGAAVMAANQSGSDAMSPKGDQFDFRDNLLSKASYGFWGDAIGEGTIALNAYFTNWTFLDNAMIGGSAKIYPSGNLFPADNGSVGFVDFAGGNYQLAASSPYHNAASDGTDVGANIAALNAATACASNGACGSTPVTPPPTPPDTTPPSLSAIAVSALTSSNATVGWTSDESSTSQVDYGPTAAYGSSTALATPMVTSHSQSVGGLAASTLYHYRVKSRDAAGNLATSADATFTTLAAAPVPPADTTAPTLSAIAASGITVSGATIAWTSNEAADSQVEYGLTSAYGSSTALDATLATAHSQTVSGLAASTVYHYRVKSRDAAGNLATSGDLTFTTPASTTVDTTKPVLSAITVANLTATTATITWTTNEPAASRVQYGWQGGGVYDNQTPWDTPLVTSHSETITGLLHSTLYHYRVKSRDGAGNTVTSKDFTFTTPGQ